MNATYDPDVDALSVELVPGARHQRTVELGRGLLAHFDGADRLVELEILGASAMYPAKLLATIDAPEDWLTLPVAAREARLQPVTLRVQIRNGKLAAKKQGRDWLISRAALWTYLENRKASGRPGILPRRRQQPA